MSSGRRRLWLALDWGSSSRSWSLKPLSLPRSSPDEVLDSSLLLEFHFCFVFAKWVFFFFLFASASDSSGIEDKIDRLMKGIDALEGLSSRAPTSVPGTTRSALNATVLPISSSSWIMDTGATDHMTGESRILSSFSSASSEKVRLADGSLTPISGLGTAVVSPSLSLSSVLLVPSFPSNLLSVSLVPSPKASIAVSLSI